MSRTKTDQYHDAVQLIERDVGIGIISEEDGDVILRFTRAFDPDAEERLPDRRAMYPASGRKVKHVAAATRALYLNNLKRAAAHLELTDPELKASDLNTMIRGLIYGDLPNPVPEDCEVTDKGGRTVRSRYEPTISHNTASTLATVLGKFYRWYSIEHETSVDVHRINDFEAPDGHEDSQSWTARDMLEPAEEQALWDACRNSLERAWFYTLRWTGMRKTAAMWLTWGDIDFERGEYYFPTTDDGEGLKGIADRSAPRPLLHAEKALRAWEADHPDSDDPDAHVFTANPVGYGSGYYDPTNPVSESTPGRVLERIVDRTDVEKPHHPHMMRHNYVTTLKTVWRVDDATIKWLIGHAEDSQVMETTYAHLSTDDYHDEVLIAGGFKEPDEARERQRGDTCVNCKSHTDPSAPFCQVCGRPQDVKAWLRQEAAEDQLARDTTDAALEASTEREKAGVRAAAEVQAEAKRDPDHAALLETVAQLQEQNERMAERLDELEAGGEADEFDPEAHDVTADIQGRAPSDD